MCNRVVQKDKIVKPGERVVVLLKGPGAQFEMPFEAVFAGPAKSESRGYWIKREGAEPVIVPDVTRFGERNKATGAQGWADVPPGSSLEGLLLPMPPGKDYRLLKVVTGPPRRNNSPAWAMTVRRSRCLRVQGLPVTKVAAWVDAHERQRRRVGA